MKNLRLKINKIKIQNKSVIFVSICLFILSFVFALQTANAAQTTFTNSLTTTGLTLAAPSVPAGLTATAVSNTQIDLSWSASVANYYPVAGYRIFRDGVFWATTTSITYSDTGLSPETNYDYNVEAFDTLVQLSGQSTMATATTTATPVATPTPTPASNGGGNGGSGSAGIIISNIKIIPGTNQAEVSFVTSIQTQANLSWGFTNDFEAGSLQGLVYSYEHTQVITGLTEGLTYQLKITARGSNGETVSKTASFVTILPVSELGPLPNPSDFVAQPGDNNISLNWVNPTDPRFNDVRIVRTEGFYPIDQFDGLPLYEGDGESFVDTTAKPGVTYYYAIFSRDRAMQYSSGALAQARIALPGEIATTTIADPFANIPQAKNVDPRIRALTLSDFEFVQDGKNLATVGETVAINGDKNLTIRLKYEKVPEILKTVAFTLKDPNDSTRVFPFLLRINSNKTYYEATIGALGKSGRYGMSVTILDYENNGLMRLDGTLAALAFTPVISFSNGFDFFGLLILLLIIILIILAIILVRKWLYYSPENSRRYPNNQKKALASVFVIIITNVILFSSFFGINKVFAAFNSQINYQGKLTNSSNAIVADGNYNIRFKLYTSLSGGSPIWTETWCNTSDCAGTGIGADNRIPLVSGLFSTMLGSTTSLSGIDFNQPLYLGVEIGGSGAVASWDGEMSPRKILGAVPAAFVAQSANTLSGLNSTEFFRTDAQNATSSASTFLNIVQTGAGKIAEFFGSASQTVLAILSNGNVGIGTTTPYAKLSVAGEVVAENFTSTSTTASSIFPLITSTTATTTNLSVTSITSSLLKTNSLGQLVAATAGTDYTNFGYLFPSNATSTILSFNGGLTSYASTTIGNGTQTGGLTISGDATTTGALNVIGKTTLSNASTTNLSVSGSFSLGSTPTYTESRRLKIFDDGVTGNARVSLIGTSGLLGPGLEFVLDGSLTKRGLIRLDEFGGTNYGLSFFDTINGTVTQSMVLNGGNLGIGTTSPSKTLAVQGNALISGNITAANITATGTASLANLILSGSTTLQNFTALNGTTTNSTSTSLFASSFISTNATSTSFFSNILNGASSTLSSLTVGQITAGNIVATSTATSTFTGGLYASLISAPYFHATSSTATSTFAGGLDVLAINQTGSASSTFANGINLDSGCFSINGTCIGSGSGSGTVNSGTIGQFAFYGSNGTAVSATSSIFVSSASKIGIGTTSPWAKLSINPVVGDGPSFAIGSSTGTKFVVDNGGKVGIGTTTPYAKLSIVAASANSPAFSISNSDDSSAFEIRSGGYNADNTFIGLGSGMSNVNGDSNTALGNYALLSNTSGYSNIAVGLNALRANTSGDSNVAMGDRSLWSNTTGQYNTAFGTYSLISNVTGTDNTAIGNVALYNNVSATSSVAVGSYAGYGQPGFSSASSTFIGTFSGYNISSGIGNTFLGYMSGYNVSSGSNNIVIGQNVDVPSATANQQLNIGNLIYGTNIYGGQSLSSSPALNGRIGIGTTTPSQNLSVQGNALISGNITAANITATGTASLANLILSGSTTLQNFTALNGTTTNATSTNLFASSFIATDATSTSFFSNILNGASSTLSSLTVGQITAGNIVATSTATSTFTGGLYASLISAPYFHATSTATSTFAGGLDVLSINQTGSASSTFANGINLAAGCFAISGTCIGSGSGSGTVNSGTTGQFAFYGSNGTAVSATSSIFVSSDSKIGVGTTSPWAKLSINPVVGDGPSFAIGSSAGTKFIVDNAGNVGVGISDPSAILDVARSGDDALINSTVYEPSPQSYHAGLIGRKAEGTMSNPTAVPSGVNLLVLGGKGYDGTSFATRSNALIAFQTAENFTSSAQGTHIQFETTPIGSDYSNRTERMIITANGNVGIGTSSPGQMLSVAGDVLGHRIIGSYFISTSTTASSLRYASTTALTVSGTNGLTLGTLNGPLQAINGAVSASSTISVAYGGTGVSTAPSYGQLLVGDGNGNYSLTATSSLGILASSAIGLGSVGQIPYYSTAAQAITATSSLFISTRSFIGIGTTTPDSALSVFSTASPQFQLAYDKDNYLTTGVSSSGGITMAVNGTSGGFAITNPQPTAVGSGTGTAAPLGLSVTGGIGGNSLDTNIGIGGIGGGIQLNAGAGGTALLSTFSETGGAGGAVSLTGGTGGAAGSPTVAFMTRLAGAGGTVTIAGGAGGAASNGGASSANTAGAGGAFILNGGIGGDASGATTNNGGAGGSLYITGGAGGTGSSANGNAGNVYLGYNSSSVLGNVYFGNQDISYISSTGNFGIATSSPYAKLSVAGEVVGQKFTATSTTATSTLSGGLVVAGTSGLNVLQGGKVAIGAANPGSKFGVTLNTTFSLPEFASQNIAHFVGADGSDVVSQMDVFGGHGVIDIRRANGTLASPSALVTSDEIGAFSFRGYADATSYASGGGRAAVTAYAAENWSSTNMGSYLLLSTTPLGSTALTTGMKIGPDGVSGNNSDFGVGTFVPNVFGYNPSIQRTLTILGGQNVGSRAVLELAARSDNNVSGSVIGQIDFNAQSQSSTKRIAMIMGLLTGSASGDYGSDLTFYTKADGSSSVTEKFRINNAGNVGVGTTSPSKTLSVQGNSYVSGTSFFGGAITATSTLNVTGLTTLGNASTTQIGSTGSAYFATLGGSVGIGTTTPTFPLTVYNTGNPAARFDRNNSSTYSSNASASTIQIHNSNLTTNNFSAFNFTSEDTASNNRVGAAITGIFTARTSSNITADMSFQTSNAGIISEVMRLTSGGNIGIGSTSPWANLSVNGTSTQTVLPLFAVASSTGSATSTAFIIDANGKVGIGTSSPLQQLSVAGSAYFTGNVGIATSSPGALFSVAGNSLFGIGSGSTFAANFGTFAWSQSATTTILDNTSGAWSISTSSDPNLLPIISITTKTGQQGTTSINSGLSVGGGLMSFDYTTGFTSVNGLQVSGVMNFDTDAGVIGWADLPISSSALVNTPQSYTATVGSAPVLTVYGEADGSGNSKNLRVGVGSTTPFATLSVNGSTTSATSLAFAVADSASVARFVIQDAGNVGIGTANPSNKLSFGGGSAQISLDTADGSDTASLGFTSSNWNGTGAISDRGGYLFTYGNEFGVAGYKGRMTFGAGNTYTSGLDGAIVMRTGADLERMVILNNGNVGIGTTSPGQKLSVAGDILGNNIISQYFTATSTTATSTFYGFIDVLGTGANSTSTISSNLWVKGTLRSNLSYVGDLIFANNFAFTEALPINSTTTQGLYLNNQKGNRIFGIDENGNMNITGDICSKNVACVNESLSKLSSDVDALASSTASLQSGLTTTSTVQSLADAIVALDLKVDAFIASSTLSVDSIIASTTLALASSTDFVSKVSSSTANVLVSDSSFVNAMANIVKNILSNTQDWVMDKFTAKVAYLNRVEAETVAISKGMEIVDQVNGSVWCVTIKNGDWNKVQGSCASVASTTNQIIVNPTPVPTPSNTIVITTTPEATTSPIAIPGSGTASTTETAIATSSSSVASTTPIEMATSTTETITPTSSSPVSSTTSTETATSTNPVIDPSPTPVSTPIPSPTLEPTPAATPTVVPVENPNPEPAPVVSSETPSVTP